ncbi:MAG: endonuclease MutS2 [Pelosinus sp.]|nr:endonuclease MutS2 [Pelosinus sp.]
MDKSVLHTLEYHKIRDMLAGHTGSVMGKELAEALEPVSDKSQVQFWLDETKEARDIMAAVPSIPLGGFRDIRSIIKRADLGAILDPTEIAAVANTLYAARRIKNFFSELAQPALILKEYASQIVGLRKLEQAIENAISEQGTLLDEASAELVRIRREIRQTQGRVKDKLDSILHSAEYQKYFQDALVTIRGDRYAIPIKQEYRHNFPGIVHDQSASGATLFIEPMAVVNLNNDIKQLMSAEKTEIERILQMLSGQIASVADEITIGCQMLAKLDFAFAKARLSFEMRAQMPVIDEEGYVELQRARHPLIPAEHVVPIDIRVGRDFTILLLTGPNTGGKTVSLKTLGLFALMMQAGLFIPAASGSRLPIFNNIFADIGDEQSIEQSLSTFSAHMTNVVKILTRVAPRDLVLMDEMGAGTDPDEGAALAMSILEHLLNVSARVIATTHYSELKTFAFTQAGIENASVEFDIETLRPTYRLLIGVPGSSNAFSISRRLGLSEKIVNRAKDFIDEEHAEFEEVLTSLEQQKKIYAERNEKMKALEQELTSTRQQIAVQQAELNEKKGAILHKAQNEAAALMRQARREAEEIISDLKAQLAAKNIQGNQQNIDKARKRIKDSLGNLNTLEDDSSVLPGVAAEELNPGMNVYVTSLRQKGIVLSVSGNEAYVQLGIMKVNVKLSDCRQAEETRQKGSSAKGQKANTAFAGFAKAQAVARQVDVRGTNVEEAVLILEKYLDDAILAGLSEVIVIHGKGTGALRKGVRSFLKNHQYVRDISIGEFNEGGDGATVVKLR